MKTLKDIQWHAMHTYILECCLLLYMYIFCNCDCYCVFLYYYYYPLAWFAVIRIICHQAQLVSDFVFIMI